MNDLELYKEKREREKTAKRSENHETIAGLNQTRKERDKYERNYVETFGHK